MPVTLSDSEIPALAECSLKLAWDIKRDRHAALVMIDANLHEFEFEGRLHKLLQDAPNLADKAFVTKVYHCFAYAQFLSEYGQSGQVYVGFKGGNSTRTGKPALSTFDVDHAWLTSSQGWTWNTGKYYSVIPPYTPLVTLRQIAPQMPSTGYR